MPVRPMTYIRLAHPELFPCSHLCSVTGSSVDCARPDSVQPTIVGPQDDAWHTKETQRSKYSRCASLPVVGQKSAAVHCQRSFHLTLWAQTGRPHSVTLYPNGDPAIP